MVDAFGRHIFKIVPSGSIPWSNRMSVSRVVHGQTKQREAGYANKFSMAFFAKFARLLVCLHLVGKNASRIPDSFRPTRPTCPWRCVTLPKGMYDRLTLIICHLLDIDQALCSFLLRSEVKFNKSWKTFFSIKVLFYVHDIMQLFTTFHSKFH